MAAAVRFGSRAPHEILFDLRAKVLGPVHGGHHLGHRRIEAIMATRGRKVVVVLEGSPRFLHFRAEILHVFFTLVVRHICLKVEANRLGWGHLKLTP
eukprot:TRINITY_DN56716_c0_g1_i1.p1 TRINITY_DN56716_c0_g1~~TRINITY_DN56716_c0_g1_i1.p1  ORF type:complete len:106 (-),score=11.49 TRINITY_DN56716_c0_g1_i1:81-371(-)